MQALVRLARAHGAVVSRDDLIQSCWGGRAVSEDAINRCIAKLRQLAEKNEAASFVIETIPRVGYRLAFGPVSAPAEKSEPELTRAPSICVLPFANMSDDPQQEYFADGITEDIITDLHKISSLFVVARTTAFTFKGKHVEVPQVSQQLKVSHILEGSVRKSGDRVRITAQLVDGTTGGHVWAERYDRDLKDIFALQDEISHSIARAMKLKLRPEEDESLGHRGTHSLEAYDLYLMARRYFASGGEGEQRSLEAVERLTLRSVEIDRGYARAWALLGAAQTALHFGHLRAHETGLPALERALSLDPGVAEAHSVIARHFWEQGNWDDAAAHIEEGLRLDPESWFVNSESGRFNYVQRRFEDAIRYWEMATALRKTWTGDMGMLMSSYAAVGNREGMLRAAQAVAEHAEETLASDYINVTSLACGVGAFAVLGQRDRAMNLIERGLLMDPHDLCMRYNFACGVSAFMKDADTAIELLGPVFESISPSLLKHAKVDPDLDPIRKDPRFQRMMAEAQVRLSSGEGIKAA